MFERTRASREREERIGDIEELNVEQDEDNWKAYVSGECLGVSKLYGTHLLCARQQRVEGALHLPVA